MLHAPAWGRLCWHRLADHAAWASWAPRKVCRHLWDAVCQPLLLHETVDVALVHLQAVLQLTLGLRQQARNKEAQSIS